MDKSPDAFRTISEVAQDLDVPQHVLRFWESKFAQVRPMKRGGGRRYYRPNDVELLRGIRHLLYGEGYTIRGVQKLLKERGVASVAAMAKRGREESAAADGAAWPGDGADPVPAPPLHGQTSTPGPAMAAAADFARNEPVLMAEHDFAAAGAHEFARHGRTEPQLTAQFYAEPIAPASSEAANLAESDRELLRAALADLEEARTILTDARTK
ncbi:MerR family transcriptional regulator [Rhodoligotrophos defluvii]|uniref:MerR family transcriptional regulator n=1 Tax=Rhodoligotrophos defluvii TaxID=2561934 RepID=UPI0010C98D8B|nr:MerR family transcriptional regulator [Rhodoligotrophos defluvii]